MVSEEMYTDTTAGEERLPVPTSFMREYEPTSLWYYSASADRPYTPLIKRSLGPLTAAMGDVLETTGVPTNYALSNAYFILRPVPDAVYRIKMRCYLKQSAISSISSSATNTWLQHAPDLLIALATRRLAVALQMGPKQLQAYALEHGALERAYLTELNARDHANRRYQAGIL